MKGPKMNPTSAPQLLDPRDRTASRTVRQAVHTELIGLPVQRNSAGDNAGWRASSD
jgi:hypothetical protein